ncbi:MAG: DUF1015 domain-containing protein [Anaerocolumna sp.]
MAIIKPFQSIRPNVEFASKIAALPYDVYNTLEAKAEIEKQPFSFLRVDRAETQFDHSIDVHDPLVYKKAKEILDDMLLKGQLIEDKQECYYIYELIMNNRSQTGLVACASIDDYLDGVIKKHENTRTEKEIDRINHVDVCDAQTGPIFLAYRSKKAINEVIQKVKLNAPLYDFISDDQVTHRAWRISDMSDVLAIHESFLDINDIYIADGHHRAASAVKVGLKRREENSEYNGKEEFNYFLSVLFPEEELKILPYNRAIKDLNGLTFEEFVSRLKDKFEVTQLGDGAFSPEAKGTFGMYLEGIWYKLVIKEIYKNYGDPVNSLDVSILQQYLFDEILGIKDPCSDVRIDFIGGIRGLKELELRANTDMKIAFSMYPTDINELFVVSDMGKLMPPKSTWFEPKLRIGLFIHKLQFMSE